MTLKSFIEYVSENQVNENWPSEIKKELSASGEAKLKQYLNNLGVDIQNSEIIVVKDFADTTPTKLIHRGYPYTIYCITDSIFSIYDAVTQKWISNSTDKANTFKQAKKAFDNSKAVFAVKMLSNKDNDLLRQRFDAKKALQDIEYKNMANKDQYTTSRFNKIQIDQRLKELRKTKVYTDLPKQISSAFDILKLAADKLVNAKAFTSSELNQINFATEFIRNMFYAPNFTWKDRYFTSQDEINADLEKYNEWLQNQYADSVDRAKKG